MKGRRFFGVVLLLLLVGTFLTAVSIPQVGTSPSNIEKARFSAASYENVTTHEGGLIIDGTQTFVIENCTYIESGNIYLSDQGKMVVENANLILNQTYLYQYGIFINQSSQLEMKNVEAISPYVFPINLQDFGKAELEAMSTNGCFSCYGNSSTQISDSLTYANLYMGDYAQVMILNSTHLNPLIALDFRRFPQQPLSINKLGSGFFVYWNIIENMSARNIFNLTIRNSFVGSWSLWFPSDIVRADVVNCTLSSVALDYSEQEINVSSLRTGFFSFWNVQNIYIVNSSIADNWALILESVNATFSDCNFHLNIYGGLNNISVDNSSLRTLILDGSNTSIYFNQTLLYDATLFFNSNLHLSGNITFQGVVYPQFVSSQVVRNYDITATDLNGSPIESAQLELYDRNNTQIWNGFTDSSGTADFNLTFTDSNYTDALRLEAVKGNLSGTADVVFLSDTPVILTLQGGITADVNGDGKVDMKDVSYVARRFMCGPSDSLWNSIADINADGKIDMKDISTIAKHFGEHYP